MSKSKAIVISDGQIEELYKLAVKREAGQVRLGNSDFYDFSMKVQVLENNTVLLKWALENLISMYQGKSNSVEDSLFLSLNGEIIAQAELFRIKGYKVRVELFSCGGLSSRLRLAISDGFGLSAKSDSIEINSLKVDELISGILRIWDLENNPVKKLAQIKGIKVVWTNESVHSKEIEDE